MKKSRYDSSQEHRATKAWNEARMAEIQAADDNYLQNDEYQYLRAQVRIADLKIKVYDRQIARGVKF